MIASTRSPARRRAVVGLFAALAACSSSDSTGGNGGTVSVAAATSQMFLVQGGTVKTTITLTRSGYNAPVTLTATGVPTGVTASFSPDSFTGSVLTSTLTLTAAVDAPTFQGVIGVTVTGSDGTGNSAFIPLTVLRPQLTVSRVGTGSGTVTSNPPGINCGGACSTSFPAGTNMTLTATAATGSVFAGWSGACSGTTTCSFTLGASATVSATFNSTAQSFSFAIDRTTATVSQGGNSTATANITRLNGYAGAVTLALTGLPSGLTIAANPTSITGDAAALNIAAASTVPAGTYPITVSATGAGINGTQTTTLNVQVTPAQGGSGDVAISFAACDPGAVPIWFAAQNGSGAWTRINPTNNTYSFTAGATNGVAWVTPADSGFLTNVFYGTRAELTAIALGSQCTGAVETGGSKHLTGSFNGADPRGTVTVALGGAIAEAVVTQGTNFSIDHVPVGRRDLVAVVAFPNTNGTLAFSRMIFRRGVNYTTSIPTLEFVGGADAFAPTFQAIQVTNGLPDQVAATASFLSANGGTGEYLTAPAGPFGNVGYVGVPDAMLQPGDLHQVSVFAAAASGTAYRIVLLMRHSAGADAVTLGPALSQPTVSTLGTSPTLRLRSQLPFQTEYSAAANAEFDQGANSVSVTMTAAYAGGTQAAWTLDIPDLASAGYNTTWGLKSGSTLDWQVIAGGGNILSLLGAVPADGDRISIGGAAKSSVTFSRFGPFATLTRRHQR